MAEKTDHKSLLAALYPSLAGERLERDHAAALAACDCPPGDIHLPSCAVQSLYLPRSNGRLKPEYIDPEIPLGAALHIYWCPKCQMQTERAWHIASRPNPLIPQNDVEHSCIRVCVQPKP